MSSLDQLDGFSSVIAGFVAKKLVSQIIVQGRINDDLCSTINHLWTVYLLVLFAILVTFTYLIGNPIHCLAPANWPEQDVDYTNAYCWISNTYYVGMQHAIPSDRTTRSEAEITYYQWTPIIFLSMAILFKFPDMLWKFLNAISGISLKKIIRLVENTQLSCEEKYKENIKNVARVIDMWLESGWKRKLNHIVKLEGKMLNIYWSPFSKSEGTFFIGAYICVKILYTVNAIGQCFLLNVFLSNKFSFFDVLDTITQKESVRFPRVTLCDFELRQLENIQLHTVQCVLPVNLFNEKIFIFIWFWLIFVAVVTCTNFLFWFYRAVFTKTQTKYVSKHLGITKEDENILIHFTSDYLRSDGFFILRLIAKNTTNMIVADLLKELWDLYKKRIEENFRQLDQCKTFRDILRDNLPSKHILKSLVHKRNTKSTAK